MLGKVLLHSPLINYTEVGHTDWSVSSYHADILYTLHRLWWDGLLLKWNSLPRGISREGSLRGAQNLQLHPIGGRQKPHLAALQNSSLVTEWKLLNNGWASWVGDSVWCPWKCGKTWCSVQFIPNQSLHIIHIHWQTPLLSACPCIW